MNGRYGNWKMRPKAQGLECWISNNVVPGSSYLSK